MATPQFTTEELAAEEWRDVVGYESVYSVSNLGRVRREKPYNNTRRGRLLKCHLTHNGYLQVRLSNLNKHVAYSVHALVASAFIGPRPCGLHVNHIDGDKTNNHPANLEYVTPKENGTHAAKIGLYPCGERNGRSKLNGTQVRVIKRLLPSMSQRKIACLFGVNKTTVGNIKRGEKWCHVETPDVEPDALT